jgi:hypothetical protein
MSASIAVGRIHRSRSPDTSSGAAKEPARKGRWVDTARTLNLLTHNQLVRSFFSLRVFKNDPKAERHFSAFAADSRPSRRNDSVPVLLKLFLYPSDLDEQGFLQKKSIIFDLVSGSRVAL